MRHTYAMNAVTEKDLIDALKAVPHPSGTGDIYSRGMVQALKLDGGKVSLVLAVSPAFKRDALTLQEQASDALKKLKGVTSVRAVVSAERTAPEMKPPSAAGKKPVPGVKRVMAVASGKGGVGKSTVAVNLALALKSLGLKVGLMDADVYGPSAPTLLGLQKRPEGKEGKLDPLQAFGLQVMSMGFLVDTEAPLIWRGPMVGSAVRQFLYDVAWNDLDLLVVDMPPGTGDAQLTLAQRVPLAGAVIVSTPQDLALIDARKGLEMFKAINVPILGLIENMSAFVCPHCGETSHIFSHGTVQAAAKALKVPYLGEIPLAMELREASDAGKPVVAAQPESASAAAFRAIAEKIKAKLE
ncbi:MAG TPA: Mrp/NBP35 family ATP-binding protein [Sphingomonadales bacterium]|nr:Mrp/NBP35 family ATP-binding protein [Sphingomonadales bacterium]